MAGITRPQNFPGIQPDSLTGRTYSPADLATQAGQKSAPDIGTMILGTTISRPTPSGTFNGRTYSGGELDNLANSANVVPSGALTRPGIGTLGVPVSSDDGARIAALNIPRPVAQPAQGDGTNLAGGIQRPGLFDPNQAASQYRGDIADVVNNDPRSVLGTAARNARADLVWGVNTARSPLDRRAAVATFQNAMNGLEGVGSNVFLTNSRDQTALASNANTNASNIARTGLLADSRIGAAAERAAATDYSADARGDAQRDAATINAGRPRTNAAFEHGSAMSYATAYTQAMQNGLSEDDAIAYAQKNRAAFEQRAGQPQAPQDQAPQPGGSTQKYLTPPAASIQFLRQNPHAANEFDAKYGAGASQRFLSGE